MLWLYLTIRFICFSLLRWWSGKSSTATGSFRTRPQTAPTWTSPTVRLPRKPDWVIRAILHLKVWTPKHGCRRIAVYNYARPHMGIGYRTPAEVWLGKPKTIGEPQRISLWNGALRAYFFPDLCTADHHQNERIGGHANCPASDWRRNQFDSEIWRNQHRLITH